MGRLTAEERRRAFTYRQAAARGAGRPRAITMEHVADLEHVAGRQRQWPRAARLGALFALAATTLLLLVQGARVVPLPDAPTLVEWLLPRV